MQIRFDAQALSRFAHESHDVNPLHMDPDYARKTAFGRQVVFGALGGEACLRELTLAEGERLERIALEFRQTMFLGLEYAVAAQGPRIDLCDGDLVLARMDVETTQAAVIEGTRAETAFPTVAETRSDPALLSDDQLTAGIQLNGFYVTRDVDGPHPVAQTLLRLSSYLIGMEVPGQRALFSKFDMRFTGLQVANGDMVRYELNTVSFDPMFGSLALSLKVFSPEGLLAEGALAAFARKDLSAPQVEAEEEAVLDPRLEGKVALVTGASRGLGAELTRILARRGCHVAVNFRSSRDEAEALAASLSDAPGQILLLQGDAGDPAWCAQAKTQIAETFGAVDLLVLNACTPPVTIGTSDAAKRDGQAYLDANYGMVSAPLETFLDDASSVVALSSVIVESEGPEWPHYRRLKRAVEALIQNAAARYEDKSFILPRPPALMTDMSNTPLRAAQALDPKQVAGHIVEALAEPEYGTARVMSDFSAPVPVLLKPAEEAIRVAATFTHGPLKPHCDGWRQTLACSAEVELAEYGQMFRDLFDPNGALAGNPKGLNVMLVRVEDWLRNVDEGSDHGSDRAVAPTDRERELMRDSLDTYIQALSAYGNQTKCVTALLLCPASDFSKAHQAWPGFIAEAEKELVHRAQKAIPDLILIDVADYHAAYGIGADFRDEVRDDLGHIPYSDAYFGVLATLIHRCWFHARTSPYKVLVLDCDNTLWGGVCGEAGPTGVDLTGRFRAFQELLVEQSKRGMVLCLASKNVEEDVWAVFDQNPDMPLKRAHIVDHRINWHPKSDNIRSMASSLNLGLDSFAFFDDNPVEVAEVTAGCPDVTVVPFPPTDQEVTRLLQHLWLFDRFTATAEDAKRVQSYQSQVERGRLREETGDFSAFLASLNLVADLQPMTEDDLPRVAQLTQRTNQFNFTTKRKTAGEVRQWVAEEGNEIWTLRVSDKFGDYGLVGVIMITGVEDAIEVDTFLLSCRVLGRGVEHRMLAKAGEKAVERGVASVRIAFATTAKNKPARMFLDTSVPGASDQPDDFVLVSAAEDIAKIDFNVSTGEEVAEKQLAANKGGSSKKTDNSAGAKRRRQLFAALEEAAVEAPVVPVAVAAPVATGDELEDLKQLFAETLGLDAATLDPETPLERYGIDSMKIVELTVALKKQYTDLPVTFMFEHKTLGGVAEGLAELYGTPEPVAQTVTAEPKETVEQIAIIGMNGRFAGAPDLAAFWDNLSSGTCSVAEIPADRWEVDAFYAPDPQPGKMYTRKGGFIKNVDKFDNGFFRISPKEAELMDPQQRLMLENVWGLFEDAGYARDQLPRDTGVFIGALSNDYGAYANNEALIDGGAYRNADFYQIPNRVSFFFDLHGPSLLIDSACSASGTALHFAVNSLKSGSCSMAVVGGINLFLHPSRFVQYSQMKMISPTSKCSPFGSQANGTWFGEGLGTVLLKPLSKAVEDGDNIQGVILATAVNSGGRSNGFTVPDPEAQAELIASAIQSAGVGSETIGYIEAHGTGTPLGDPIEMRGLTKAFTKNATAERADKCALGTVKANIGHLESGAAMAGLIKTLLQMKHRTLAPSLHAAEVNPDIPFARSPFELNRTLSPWAPILQDGQELPRRAGISTFGAGGSNAHILVEEYRHAVPAVSTGPYLIPLSAHKEPVLKAMVQRLIGALDGFDLADVAFTLQTGREALKYRLAVIADDHADLVAKLEAWLTDGSVAGLFQAKAAQNAPAATGSDLAVLAEAWVTGSAVDWSTVQTGRAPRRVSLPVYPFNGGRHWLPGEPNMHLSQRLGLTVEKGPVRRVFRADEPVIRDHIVQATPILPGVGYLQEALVAARQADGRHCRMEHLVWAHPFPLSSGEKTLEIRHGEDGSFSMVSGDEALPHAKGVVVPSPAPRAVPAALDLVGIEARCTDRLDHGAVYARFDQLSINYGPRFNGVERMILGADEALGYLALPAALAGEVEDIVLHPTLADGALQTALLHACASGGTALPFAADAMEIFRPMTPRALAYAKQNQTNGYDIVIADEQGVPCVVIENLVLREKADPLKDMFHLPRWAAAGAAAPVASDYTGRGIVLLGGDSFPAVKAGLKALHANDHVLDLGAEHDLSGQLEGAGDIDVLYFLGGLARVDGDVADPDAVTAAEQSGAVSFFRLLKTLVETGRSRDETAIKVATNGLYALGDQGGPIPYGASLVGLAKVAAKEFPRLDIAAVDLQPEPVAADAALLAAEPGNRGEAVMIRDGVRYSRTLVPLALPSGETPPFRDGMTCVILGGAGGIGFEFSRHLSRTRNANLVWIGRRGEDDGIRTKMAAVRAEGGDVLYLSADATDPAAMAQAIEQAKARFGPIHAAVHSAIVLEDRTIARMDEAGFLRALEPKSRGAAALYQALKDEPLDWMLFLSSINSFQASMGQCNYVAGCHAKDALALSLFANRPDTAVRIVNWGYWGSVGVVASDDYRTRLAAEGHGSIEPAEGMAAIERILAQPFPQIMALKADEQRRREIGIDPDSPTRLLPRDVPQIAVPEAPAPDVAAEKVARFETAFNALEHLGRRMLVEALRRMGADFTPAARYEVEPWRRQLGVTEEYVDLFDALVDILHDSGVVARSGNQVEVLPAATDAEWTATQAELAQALTALGETREEVRERLPLLAVCHESWPDVLTGRRPHMDVVFPRGDFSLVAPIYRGNEITHAYNDAVAAYVRCYIEARLAEDPSAKINILEVGAGTGGTSRPVLAAIGAYGDHLSYTFTDVSRKFLMDADEAFSERYPFIRFQTFDFEKAASDQKFETGKYDLVLGTNCVHACTDIVKTLSSIKYTMKRGAKLVLNEFTARLDYNTLTFGLTSGWWLFTDGELRIKGSPLLEIDGWQRALELAGFSAPTTRGVEAGEVGQYLLISESDGVAAVAAPKVKKAKPSAPESAAVAAPAAPQPVISAPVAVAVGEAEAVAYVKGVFASVLKMELAEIETDEPFDAFGVDSLLSTAILERFEVDFGRLSATLMFECTTVEELARHFLSDHAAKLTEMLGPVATPQPMPQPVVATPAPVQAAPVPIDARPAAISYVAGAFASVLKMDPAEIEIDEPFDAFGVDSLLSTAILDRFEVDFGRLSATLMFECTTVEELADHFLANHQDKLHGLIGHDPAPAAAPVTVAPVPVAPAPQPQAQPVAPQAGEEIAIVGIGCRFPGADQFDDFWDSLAPGINRVGEVPGDRWRWRDHAAEAEGGRWGGFISDVDKFDSLFFNISPREAERMSPESRLFMETVWQALEHAGIPPKRLNERAGTVGVYVGCMYQHYPLQTNDPNLRGELASASYWSIANRVSHFFDFRGPSMAVDTACSASLTAIHLACESIRRGECGAAVAGGVNLTIDPGKFDNLRTAGMLGTHPQSRSLGDGDGLLPSEGVGAVVLKPLSMAEADGDMILGVIKSGSINNGGRSSGFNAPNPNAQAELVATALDKAGIHPETLSYVEVAANGSALGDPVEMTGLTKAFRRWTSKTGFCAVGAVKSNLGHPEAASGLAQLAKVLLQMRHRTLAPTLNAEPLNPKLRLDDTPFTVQHRSAAWNVPESWPEAGMPKRRAAISAFGAGGSNAHLIVEEHAAPASSPSDGAQIIILSAKTEERLIERARVLLAHLNKADTLPPFADIAYTLQTGREAMRARLAFVVADTATLIDALTRIVTAAEDGPSSIPEACAVHRNSPSAGSSPIPLLLDGEEGRVYLSSLVAARKLDKLAQLWVMGLDVDWQLVHAGRSPRRCHLPGYPFARIRHWVEAGTAPAAAVPVVAPTPAPVAAPITKVQPAKPKRASTGASETRARLRASLKGFIAEILKIPAEMIDTNIELREYGFDSINIAELARKVNETFGLELTVDLFFSHPTIDHCVTFLIREYGGQIGDGPADEVVEETPVAPASAPVAQPLPAPALISQPTEKVDIAEPVAIVGMNGYMPQSDDLHAFWDHLVAGHELIAEIPQDRLHKMGVSLRELAGDRDDLPVRGSFLKRLDLFDSLFFGISPKEAELMDPQQRLMLETVWKTIEDAGYPPSQLAGRHIGVFVGVSNHDYGKLYQRMSGQPLAHTTTGMMVQSILANRVSYLFDFHGPSEIIDTACSSSTVALHRAVTAIRNGECESALVGGVNVLLDWQGYATLNKAGILSQDGQVRLFSADGTGYVRGEGVGAVFLKPLSKALADRDHVYAVIRGSSTNFDGKKYSMTAPSPAAQTEVVRRAVAASGINPADIAHIEAQGTGSPLGDPVEVNAFKTAFRDLYQEWGLDAAGAPHSSIGYLKPQIGHLEAASGMAGLIKILMAMNTDVMPGTSNLEQSARTVDLDGTPFFVTPDTRSWAPNGRPRAAGLHSFGIGGMNAHVVLEEFSQ